MTRVDPDDPSREIAAQVLENVANGHIDEALAEMGGGLDVVNLHRTLLVLMHGFVPAEVLLRRADEIRRAL